MDEHSLGGGKGQQNRANAPYPVSSFPRIALLRLHLLLWIQSKQRRVQAHGAGTVWHTDLRRCHLQASDRPQTRWKLLAEHGLLQLLPRVDHDHLAIQRTVWWSSSQSRKQHRATAYGLGGEHSSRR